MSLVKVEGFANLKKDTTNGGVINTDTSAFTKYKASKNIALDKNFEIENIHTEINNIKNDLTDIKLILVKLLEKGK